MGEDVLDFSFLVLIEMSMKSNKPCFRMPYDGSLACD